MWHQPGSSCSTRRHHNSFVREWYVTPFPPAQCHSAVPIPLHPLFLNRTILACRILIRRAFTPNERSSLIEAILSSEDEEEAIRNLSLEDAQTFVDTINEARCTFHRHH